MQRSDVLPALLPQYHRSPKPRVFDAVFPSDQRLSVEAGRARCYPGLLGPAPDTRALYVAAAQALAGARRVIDLGCGSGIGTAELCAHFESVTALDTDLTAVAFARAYLPGVSVLHDDGTLTLGAGPKHDGVCLVDVLGQSRAPLAVLRVARRLLATTGRLFLAEPSACPSQTLLPPVVRAFSRPGLVSLLSCAGLEAETWLDGAGHFIALLARPNADDNWVWLERAEAASASGNINAALEAYASVTPSAPLPLQTEALLGRAVLHAERGELDAACQCLLDAARLEPDNARSLAGLAEISLMAGERAQALELSIKALESDPCDVIAVQSLARAADSLQQHDAFATWRIANGLGPADLGTAIELSRLAAGRGELHYAIWVLERLRDFRADLSADFHVTLAWLYITAERAGEARLEAQLARVKDAESSSVLELWAHLDS